MDISDEVIPQLSTPDCVCVTKVAIVGKQSPKKRSKEKRNKKKQANSNKYFRSSIVVSYKFITFPGFEGSIRQIEKQIAGDESPDQIIHVVQDLIHAINLPKVIITDVVDICKFPGPSDKRTRSVSHASDQMPKTVPKRQNYGGPRANAGRPTNKEILQQKKRKTSKSLKKNKRYAKSKKRMRYKKEKSQKQTARAFARENRIAALEEALNGKTSLESLLQGEKTWMELTEYQQGRLYRQATAVLQFLKLVNQFVGSRHKFYIREIRQMACDRCSFFVTPTKLEKWHKQFTANGDKFSECLTGKWEREWLLDQTDLKLEALEFLNRFNDWKQTNDIDYLKIDEFHKWLNDDLLQLLTLQEMKGITWPVSKETARVWMHRLGFGWDTYKNDIYFDGHDRPDVVEFKNEHLMRMKGYQKRSHLFFRCSVENARNKYKFSDEDIDTYLVTVGDVSCVEIPIDKFDFDRNEIEFGGDHSITVERPIIIFVQDEAIFKSYDGAKKFWKQNGKQKLRKKVMEEV